MWKFRLMRGYGVTEGYLCVVHCDYFAVRVVRTSDPVKLDEFLRQTGERVVYVFWTPDIRIAEVRVDILTRSLLCQGRKEILYVNSDAFALTLSNNVPSLSEQTRNFF
jgi:hypothetical protein